MPFLPRRYKKRTTTSRKKKTTMKPTMKKAVRVIAKQVLAEKSENKYIGNQIEYAVGHNSAISAADCLPIVPTIKVGPESSSRLGARITPKSLKVNGVMSWTAALADTSAPMYVRVCILSQKDIKVGSQISSGAVDSSNLLRCGFPGSDSQQFTGAPETIQMPINKLKFRVYLDKLVKLVVTDETVTQATAPMVNRTARWSYNFKDLPKFLTYDAGNGDWANNFAPFLAIGYGFVDQVPDVINTKLYSTVNSYFEFEDA